MFRFTILALAVFLLSACASTATKPVKQPVTATANPCPACPAAIKCPSVSMERPEAQAPKKPMVTLTMKEYIEAYYRVASRYSFTISLGTFQGFADPIKLTEYEVPLWNLLQEGSDKTPPSTQRELKRSSDGTYHVADEIQLKLKEMEASLCVSSKVLGGRPPEGFGCHGLWPERNGNFSVMVELLLAPLLLQIPKI